MRDEERNNSPFILERMKPERWQQVDQLLEAALERPVAQRPAFLAEACAGDVTLRREVESLLRADERATSFIETPALPLAVEVLAQRQAQPLTGQQLGHYQILAPLGAGGMGEVYLALDARLGRKVALKLLPAGLAADAEAKRRFTQEARTASALNHPHIITIYDIGAEDVRAYIAMEYIEGESLRALLSHEKVEIKRTLELIAQAASGLAAAHEARIFHRDIKPENLMVTRGGQLKILDFGLAKLSEKQTAASLASGVPTTHSPDAAAPAQTKPGTILGTVAYMSPEQAEGRTLDQRTDVFSLGVVLYEMLTAQRPFQGKSAVDVLHAIINVEPLPVLEVNPRLPAEVTEILGKALAKEVSERYQHAGDFELDLRRLKRAIESHSLLSAKAQPLQPATPAAATSVWQRKWVWASVALLFLCFSMVSAWWLSSLTARKLASERFAFVPLTSDEGYEGDPTFAPDGRSLAYTSDRTGNFEIFLKQVAGGPDINLTNNAADDVQPAFSPDGQQIAFVSSRAGASEIVNNNPRVPMRGGGIWVMPALGGSARRIAEKGNFPAWSPDGTTLIYTNRTKLFRVPAAGGAVSDIPLQLPVSQPQLDQLSYPSYSPDGRWITFERAGVIYLMPAAGGQPQKLLGATYAVWRADGQALIYTSEEPGKYRTIWQIPFSLAAGKTTGDPEPLTVGRGGEAQPAISRDGKQVIFTATDISSNLEISPFDAEQGRVLGVPRILTKGGIETYFHSFSPDGQAVAFDSWRGGTSHLWRLDRDSFPVQLTSDPNYSDTVPKWSPDGSVIAFQRGLAGHARVGTDLWLIAADGASPQLLKENAGVNYGGTWLPDGRSLVFFSFLDQQLYHLDLATKKERRLTDEKNISAALNISPDGQWAVYQSTLSGNNDLRAVSLQGGPSRAVVSTPRDDYHPFISPTGRWLYFQLGHKNLYRVPGPAQQWRQAAPEQVTNFPEAEIFLEDFQISRDGRQLVYTRGRRGGDLWLLKLNQ